MKYGKKYLVKAKLVENTKFYQLAEALELVKKSATAKFPETVDLAIKLGVDTVKNPSIRGTVSLPAGSGKTKKVAVITREDRAKDALDAGADVAGEKELVEKIKGGFLGFDILIASPDMMGEVGKLGKVLGPKGLMPNPKTGTVTEDVVKAVKEFKGGKVEFKMDKGGVVHSAIGKANFALADLQKNFLAVVSTVSHAKPSGFKGVYIKSITLSSSMGPGVKLDTRKIMDEVS